MELPVSSDPLVLRRGVELSIELKQHLFDTYYHAVALENADAILVTADDRYLRAARRKGRISDLMDWKWALHHVEPESLSQNVVRLAISSPIPNLTFVPASSSN